MESGPNEISIRRNQMITFSSFNLIKNVFVVFFSANTIFCLVYNDIYFLVEKPEKLNYLYQINPSYQIASPFPPYVEEIALLLAEPAEACKELLNANDVFGEAVLIERGGCSFVDKIINSQNAGAKFAIITDSTAGSEEFIDMISDGTERKGKIPAAFLPGVNGRHLREYLLYEKPLLWIQIPLNYTLKSLRERDTSKPPWEVW